MAGVTVDLRYLALTIEISAEDWEIGLEQHLIIAERLIKEFDNQAGLLRIKPQRNIGCRK